MTASWDQAYKKITYPTWAFEHFWPTPKLLWGPITVWHCVDSHFSLRKCVDKWGAWKKKVCVGIWRQWHCIVPARIYCSLFVGLCLQFCLESLKNCPVGLRSDSFDSFAHWRISYFFALRKYWVNIHSVLQNRAKSGQSEEPCALHNSSCCFCHLSKKK